MPTFEKPNEHTPITSSNDGTAQEYVPERHKGYRRKRKSSLQTLPIPKSEMKKWDPASKLERKYKQNSKRRRKRGPSIWLRIINVIRKKLGLKPLKNKRKDRYYRNKYKQRYNKKRGNKRPQNRNRDQQNNYKKPSGGNQKQSGKYKKKPYNKNRKPNNTPQGEGGNRKPQSNDYKPQNRKPRRNRRPQQQGGNQGQNRPNK